MTTETRRKVFGLYLDRDQDAKLDKIAEAMSRELGVPVSRSGAVARLITAFSLPTVPEVRNTSAVQDAA